MLYIIEARVGAFYYGAGGSTGRPERERWSVIGMYTHWRGHRLRRARYARSLAQDARMRTAHFPRVRITHYGLMQFPTRNRPLPGASKLFGDSTFDIYYQGFIFHFRDVFWESWKNVTFRFSRKFSIQSRGKSVRTFPPRKFSPLRKNRYFPAPENPTIFPENSFLPLAKRGTTTPPPTFFPSPLWNNRVSVL